MDVLELEDFSSTEELDFIEDTDSTLNPTSNEYVNSLLECLNEKQYKVICMRYGLIDGNPLTLEQVALKLDISKERVRQIEAMSIRRIRIRMKNFK